MEKAEWWNGMYLIDDELVSNRKPRAYEVIAVEDGYYLTMRSRLLGGKLVREEEGQVHEFHVSGERFARAIKGADKAKEEMSERLERHEKRRAKYAR
ncbi:hypothetical protein ABUK73_05005 [Agrobacterium sp. BA1120]|uniref:hypothetical protein n=1 Tax=Agrobacterium sp. BA1120 TaxID=3228927 RepID=UPI00336A859B